MKLKRKNRTARVSEIERKSCFVHIHYCWRSLGFRSFIDLFMWSITFLFEATQTERKKSRIRESKSSTRVFITTSFQLISSSSFSNFFFSFCSVLFY